MREVLEKFNFRDTIRKLDEAGLLFKVVERFRTVDLHPDKTIEKDILAMLRDVAEEPAGR